MFLGSWKAAPILLFLSPEVSVRSITMSIYIYIYIYIYMYVYVSNMANIIYIYNIVSIIILTKAGNFGEYYIW